MKVINKTYTSKDEVIIDLVGGADEFSYCDFSGMNLVTVNFDGCKFDGCEFVGSKLGRAAKTKFYSCNLNSVNFEKSDIRWAYSINCTAEDANFHGAQMVMECSFLAGIKSSKTKDGAIWLWFCTLADTPIRHKARAIIPAACLKLIQLIFQRT